MGLVTPRECVLIFHEDREIVDLSKGNAEVWQAASVDIDNDNMTPGVKAMEAGYGAELCGDLIRRGRDDGKGVFARLGAGSGFPYVLIGDLRMFGKGANRFRWHPELVKVGRNWRRVPRFAHPIVLPPKVAYYSAASSTGRARYPIGGWVSDADTDYYRWVCALEVDPDPNLDDVYHGPSIFRCHLTTQLLTAGADKLLLSPAFPVVQTGSASQNDAHTGTLALYSNISLCTNATLIYTGITNDLTQEINRANSGESDERNCLVELAADDITSLFWAFGLFADYKDINGDEQGDVAEKTDIMCRM